VSCYRLIDAEKAHHGVSPVLPACWVWHARATTPGRAGRWTELIRQIHARSRGIYGAPRVHAELRLGLDVQDGRKRVARLLHAAGVHGCPYVFCRVA
jgi:hypothetical protein